jgi:hypothetical protein
MEMVRVIYFHVRSSECGSPRLGQLRTDRLAPMNKICYVLMHMGLWRPTNFVALMVAELEDTPPYLTYVHWDSVEGTHRCPSRSHVEDLH